MLLPPGRSFGPRPAPGTFGQLARVARAVAGLTLANVAEATRLTPQYVSDIERGYRHAPDLSIVERWAAAVGADPLTFFTAAAAETLGRSSAGDAALSHIDAQACRIAALEAMLSNVRDVLDGYPAHTPRCPCSLCLLHAAVEGLT